MRKLLFCAVLLALSSVASTSAFAVTKIPTAVKPYCKGIAQLYNILYKYQTSGGIGNHDPRDGSCTIVSGSGTESEFPKINPLKIYDTKGNIVGQFDLYQNCPDCAFAWRYYTGNTAKLSHLCSSIVQKTHKDTGNYEAFIRIKDNLCYYIPDLRGEYGFARAN